MSEKTRICPQCKKEVIKIGPNWMIDGFILVSHNMSCDNKYLDEKKGE